MELVRFDILEYMDEQHFSRLIEAYPRYVEYVRVITNCQYAGGVRVPFCCLTRSKKAHPDVFNLLLQIMDK
ncbi:MAG: hypothetical protein ACR5K4_03140 [Sodalis sp. (in: enterobacteria)]